MKQPPSANNPRWRSKLVIRLPAKVLAIQDIVTNLRSRDTTACQIRQYRLVDGHHHIRVNKPFPLQILEEGIVPRFTSRKIRFQKATKRIYVRIDVKGYNVWRPERALDPTGKE